jgi:hypothetical protein
MLHVAFGLHLDLRFRSPTCRPRISAASKDQFVEPVSVKSITPHGGLLIFGAIMLWSDLPQRGTRWRGAECGASQEASA